MTIFRRTLLYALVLLVFSLPGSADERADHLLYETEAAIAAMPSLSVDISGTVHDRRPDRVPLTVFTGKARMQRPNLVRMVYQKAIEQGDGTVTGKEQTVIASDGKTLWKCDLRKNEYRTQSAAAKGDNLLVAGSLMDAPIYMFFHSRMVHTDVPPTYLGEERWNGARYRVIEFREASPDAKEAPRIRQRVYIGTDNRVHRFVNEQLQGKYIEDWTLSYHRIKAPMALSDFVYAPPASAKEVRESAPPMLATGTIAPDVVAEDRDGKAVRLSDMRGKVVVLDFWTTGCGHCLESQSHLNAVARKFKADVVVLALNVGDTRDVFTAWLAKHSEYDALVFALAPSAAEKERAMVLYQVPGFPMQYVIGRDGKVVKGLIGYDGPTPDLENAIKAAGGVAR